MHSGKGAWTSGGFYGTQKHVKARTKRSATCILYTRDKEKKGKWYDDDRVFKIDSENYSRECRMTQTRVVA
jgi:hypothetical protein